jgi:DNA-binding Xre family transcriptional regulator
MPMYINLEAYLSQLKAIEKMKPEDQRRKVPTLSELADCLGMHKTSIIRLSNNKVKQLSLETGDKIIAEMRRRGFPMEVGDLIVYHELEES